MILLCIYVIARYRSSVPHRSRVVLLLLFVPLVSLLPRLYVSDHIGQDIFRFVELLTICLALSSATARFADLGIVAAIGVALASESLAYAAILPSHAYMPEGMSEKAILGSSVLAGSMSHSNSLGIFLALALPYVSLWPVFLRLLASSLMWAVLVLSGSRTAIVAALVSLGLVFVTSCLSSKSEVLLSKVLLFAAGALVIVLPFSASDPSAFSGRGAIWIWARSVGLDGDALLLGTSLEWPSGIDVLEGGLARSAHNLFLQLLYTGGLSAVAITGFLLVRAGLILQAESLSRRERRIWVRYMITFLVISCMEYIFVQSAASEIFTVTNIPLLAALGLSVSGWNSPHHVSSNTAECARDATNSSAGPAHRMSAQSSRVISGSVPGVTHTKEPDVWPPS